MIRFCTVVFTGFLMLCLTDAKAQINPSTLLSATSVAATNTNYYYARPNDLTIIVNVVGFIERPGRYEIATSIDLINLISLAGGPTPDGALSKVSIIRMAGKGETTTHREMHIDLEDLSTVKQEDLQLLPGDLVLVDRTGWAAFRDVFPVVVSAATVAIFVTQILILKK
jgi:NADH:ubiquinone oxidoreductase subunit F (NADH-binding)